MKEKRNNEEHNTQSELVGKLPSLLRPQVIRLAIPNGGARHPLVGKMLKEEGLLPGSPDLLFAYEDAGVYWLEMKALKGRLSDEQVGLHYRLRQNGHTVDVARSVEEALDLLARQGLLR